MGIKILSGHQQQVPARSSRSNRHRLLLFPWGSWIGAQEYPRWPINISGGGPGQWKGPWSPSDSYPKARPPGRQVGHSGVARSKETKIGKGGLFRNPLRPTGRPKITEVKGQGGDFFEAFFMGGWLGNIINVDGWVVRTAFHA